MPIDNTDGPFPDDPWNDYHQEDTCDECGAPMDCWRTFYGDHYYLQWICTDIDGCGEMDSRVDSVEEVRGAFSK